MTRRADVRFAYRLAAKLGRLDPMAMLAEMTATDLARWEAYFLLEPWGPEMDDHRAGVIASTIANCNRGKSTKPFRPDDFFPNRIPKPKPNVDEQIHAVFGPMVGRDD